MVKSVGNVRSNGQKQLLSRHPEISQMDESILGKIDNQRAGDMEVHVNIEPSVSNSVSAELSGRVDLEWSSHCE